MPSPWITKKETKKEYLENKKNFLIHTHLDMHTQTHMPVHTHTYKAYMHMQTHNACMYIQMHIHTHACTCSHTCTHINAYAHGGGYLKLI